MEKTVNIHTAKTTLSKLIAAVENGEEIVIARAGKPVARLVGAKKKKAKAKPRIDRKPGFMKGKIWIAPDFDDPWPEEIAKAFRGEGD
jgi:prevent-host-death family protein